MVLTGLGFHAWLLTGRPVYATCEPRHRHVGRWPERPCPPLGSPESSPQAHGVAGYQLGNIAGDLHDAAEWMMVAEGKYGGRSSGATLPEVVKAATLGGNVLGCSFVVISRLGVEHRGAMK